MKCDLGSVWIEFANVYFVNRTFFDYFLQIFLQTAVLKHLFDQNDKKRKKKMFGGFWEKKIVYVHEVFHWRHNLWLTKMTITLDKMHFIDVVLYIFHNFLICLYFCHCRVSLREIMLALPVSMGRTNALEIKFIRAVWTPPQVKRLKSNLSHAKWVMGPKAVTW